jgi:hypothetical protein
VETKKLFSGKIMVASSRDNVEYKYVILINEDTKTIMSGINSSEFEEFDGKNIEVIVNVLDE